MVGLHIPRTSLPWRDKFCVYLRRNSYSSHGSLASTTRFSPVCFWSFCIVCYTHLTMEPIFLKTSHWMLGLGLVFLATSTSVLVLNKAKREAVLARININRRRLSGAHTPPRSLSPSKKISVSTNEKPSYITTFPPSRREALSELAKTVSATNAQILLSQPSSADFLQNLPLPMTESYNAPNAPIRYTPTGFSTAEIRAMGDFPAYDILSGVPLPEAYENFNVKTALPRPYRPFRWAYHQTMCKTKFFIHKELN